jgi:hypothetical protein
MADVIPTTLVSEAMSQSVFASGRGEVDQSNVPTPYSTRMLSPVPMTANAPGNALSARALSSTARTESRSNAIVAGVGPVRRVMAGVVGGVAETVVAFAAHPNAPTTTTSPQLREVITSG